MFFGNFGESMSLCIDEAVENVGHDVVHGNAEMPAHQLAISKSVEKGIALD